jgi:transcriptional regulator with XRE-family HTH domain
MKQTLIKRASRYTPDELLVNLGERLRRLRLRQNLDQIQTAEKAGVSEKALRNLEAGRGSNLVTLLRVLKALDALDSLDALAPAPSVSPLALLKHGDEPKRVSRPRKKTDASTR